MKIYDKVKVLKEKESYLKNGVHAGDEGIIFSAEIREGSFEVIFETGDDKDWFKYCDINIEDLELIEEGFATDEMILEELPNNDPRWWCKVEEGFILNLKGEKKNKEAYKYKS